LGWKGKVNRKTDEYIIPTGFLYPVGPGYRYGIPNGMVILRGKIMMCGLVMACNGTRMVVDFFEVSYNLENGTQMALIRPTCLPTGRFHGFFLVWRVGLGIDSK